LWEVLRQNNIYSFFFYHWTSRIIDIYYSSQLTTQSSLHSPAITYPSGEKDITQVGYDGKYDLRDITFDTLSMLIS